MKEYKMQYIKLILLSAIAIFAISGCSMKGIEYSPNFNSINELKDNNLKKMDIKRSFLDKDKNEAISLGRGSNKMLSPYGGSFSKYLEIALEEELKQASLYDHESNIKIKTKLLKNKLDTGMATGTADLSADFKILISNEEVFNKVYEVHHEWESSFVGAVAIPATIENYPVAMQKLIDKFLFDKDVIRIIKR